MSTIILIKNWKKWANEVYFVYFFIYLSIFKCYLNMGKYIKLNFLIKVQKLYAFSQNWNTVNAKKHKCYFFRGSIMNFLLTYGLINFSRAVVSRPRSVSVPWSQFHQRFFARFFVRKPFFLLHFGFEQTFVQKSVCVKRWWN